MATTTTTTTVAAEEKIYLRTDSPVPEKLAFDISALPKLTREQAGHLRHFHNLSARMDGDWHLMGSQEPAQEWLDALRYQLATMVYASGLTHYHRLPALRSVFKPLMRRLIQKMLHRAVWGYWYLTSQSGIFVDPSLTELRKPWADPVSKENIMYSGHLLLMISQYAMLFDDDEFEKPGSLVFDWNPLFFGFGPEKYVYDRFTLQDGILKDMEKNKWMGVCCEPNVVFVVCNQFPLVAIKVNDARDGTNLMESVIAKYRAAWAEKHNMVTANSLYVDWWQVKQDHIIQPSNIGFTAWSNAYMNTWNSELIYDSYDKQALGFITPPTKTSPLTVINPPHLAAIIRQLVTEGGPDADATDPELLAKAKQLAAVNPPRNGPYKQPIVGYVVQWLSELGRDDELNGLLAHAEKFFNPTWKDGGLYYPRSDQRTDKNDNDTHMDPFTGNSAIGYARLNVKDGQKKMSDEPWTKKTLGERPWVDGVGLEEGVDFLRGEWLEEKNAMVTTMRSWSGEEKALIVKVRNLSGRAGTWGVYLDGLLKETVILKAGVDEIVVEVTVGEKDVDLVVVKV